MKPTQEQVIAWAFKSGLSEELWMTPDKDLHIAISFAALAYEAGRKDENETCAKFCQQSVKESEETNAKLSPTELIEKAVVVGGIHVAHRIGAAIRARREQ